MGWALLGKDVGCRSNFDPSRPLYTQDTSFSVKSSLTAVRQGAKVPSSDNFVIRVFAIYLIMLGWKTNNIMKPTSPNQGQANPRIIRFKVAFGSIFPTANHFSCVGIGFI